MRHEQSLERTNKNKLNIRCIMILTGEKSAVKDFIAM
jgi:hypothetical protein